MNGVVAVRNARTVSKALADLGQRFYARGWALGTSGNFSEVVSRRPLRLAITASGPNKRTLRPSHILTVDGNGKTADPPRTAVGRDPSARHHRPPVRCRRHRAHALDLQHGVVGRARRCGRLSHPGIRDAEGPDGVSSHEHQRVDSDSRERSGHAAPGRGSGTNARSTSQRRTPCCCAATGCIRGARRSTTRSGTSKSSSFSSRRWSGDRATM